MILFVLPRELGMTSLCQLCHALVEKGVSQLPRPRLASNCNLPGFHFLSSWSYRLEPWRLALNLQS
jgi:hypothetical protein